MPYFSFHQGRRGLCEPGSRSCKVHSRPAGRHQPEGFLQSPDASWCGRRSLSGRCRSALTPTSTPLRHFGRSFTEKKTVRRSVQVHVSQSNEENLQHRSSVVIVVSIATNGLQQSWRVMMISWPHDVRSSHHLIAFAAKKMCVSSCVCLQLCMGVKMMTCNYHHKTGTWGMVTIVTEA